MDFIASQITVESILNTVDEGYLCLEIELMQPRGRFFFLDMQQASTKTRRA